MSIDPNLPKSEFIGLETMEESLANAEKAENALLVSTERKLNEKIYHQVISVAMTELRKRMVSFGHTDQRMKRFQETLEYFSSLPKEIPQSGKVSVSALHKLFEKVTEVTAKLLEEIKEADVKTTKNLMLEKMREYESEWMGRQLLDNDFEEDDFEEGLDLENLEIGMD